ncbi:MAG: YncE family protein [Thermoleophilia bacterium]
MKRIQKNGNRWLAAIAAGLIAAFLLAATGCGSNSTSTSASTSASTSTNQSKGKAYVAVVGSSELQASAGNMGMAVVNLDTRQVEMVNLTESKAPHGILFGADTMTAANTGGRVATQTPSLIYLGNSEDGSINVIDVATNKVTKTINAPAGAKLAICGMEKGPDGLIYLTSMGDGKVYLFDTEKGQITETKVGGGNTTNSICGIVWSRDAQYAYLSNMYNPNDPTASGYVAKVKWPSGELVSKIENVTNPSNTGTAVPMAHQMEMTPDGKYIYVTDGEDSSIVKIDAATDKVLGRFPAGKEPHSIVFSADGKTAYIAVRHDPIPDQSSVFVYDVASDKVIDKIAGIPASLVCGLILSQ